MGDLDATQLSDRLPPLSIVDSHQKVLVAWAAYRRTLSQPPRLVTLDHHTDTSRPFRRLIANVHGRNLEESEFKRIQDSHLGAIDFSVPESVEDSISKLNNDEHIVAAIKTNIISSAFVIAHNASSTGLDIYNQHRIVCHGVSQTKGADHKLVLDYDRVLESSFLGEALFAFDKVIAQAEERPLLSTPYILDIDLDYFNTFQSVSPIHSDGFKAIAKNAGLITVATEPDYVQSCAIDSGLSSDYLLNKLKQWLLEFELENP